MSRSSLPQSVSPAAEVAHEAELAAEVVVGPFSVIGPGARIGAQTVIGANVVVHADTVIGAQCLIEDGVVLGKRPRLRPGSSAAGGELGALSLGDGVTVCSGAVVYAGTEVGERAILGDQTQIRERVRIGSGTVVGRGSCVDFGAEVGQRVLIQTGVYVTGGTVVEDDVFLGPGVQTTNDHAMGRHPKGEPLKGPVLRRACRVGGAAVLVPGVEIGEEAFVGAGAVVTRDVGARQVVLGVPARVVRQVAEEDLLQHWR